MINFSRRIEMDATLKVIKQDLSAAINAFEEENFKYVNIMANRIMSNSLMGDNKNDYMIVGQLVKEISGEFGNINDVYKERIKDCKTIGSKFLKELQNYIEKEEYQVNELWESFYQYEKNIRGYFMTDIEIDSYDENLEFTRKVTIKLLKNLQDNKHILVDEKNVFLAAILNEISRIINVHGGEKQDFIFYFMIKTLGQYYGYLVFSETTRDGILKDEDRFKSKIYPYIDKIIEIFSNIEELDLESVTETLAEITIEWRKYILIYWEISKPPKSQKKELPEEAKEVLNKALTGVFEGMIKGK